MRGQEVQAPCVRIRRRVDMRNRRIRKRIMSVMLALVMTVGTAQAAFAAPTDDELLMGEAVDELQVEAVEEADTWQDFSDDPADSAILPDEILPDEDGAEIEPVLSDEEIAEAIATVFEEEDDVDEAQDADASYADETVYVEPSDDVDEEDFYADADADEEIDASAAPPVKDYYERYDGTQNVGYYRVNTNNFSKSETDFYRDILNGKMTYVPNTAKYPYTNAVEKNAYQNQEKRKNHSARQYWTKIGAAIMRKYFNGSKYEQLDSDSIVIDYIGGDEKDFYENHNYFPWGGCVGMDFRHSQSMKTAEQEMLSCFPISGTVISHGLFQSGEDNEKGPVFYKAAYQRNADGKAANLVAVVFSDFKVVPILPDASASEGNYVVTTVENSTTTGSPERSAMINDSELQASKTQSVERSVSGSVRSEVTGSSTYSFTESLTIGAEYGFSAVAKGSLEIGVSATEEFQYGWTQGTEHTDSDTKNHTLESGPMPAYTGVFLQQSNTVEEVKTVYNCPVAVTYRVRLLYYRVGYNKNSTKINNNGNDVKAIVIADFGPDAQKDLYNRYIIEGHNDRMDKDNINWNDELFQSDVYLGTKTAFMLRTMASVVPIAATSARFTEKYNTVESKVAGLAPTKPLARVHTKDAKLTAFSLSPGETERLDEIELEALNSENANYYGFDPECGHWIVTDLEGKELTDGKVVTISKDPMIKRVITMKAVAPGEVYIKYLIDENKYATFYDRNTYATNASLTEHPYIKVTVNGTSVTNVALDKTEIKLAEGETADLAATVTPADASVHSVTWSSEDYGIADAYDGKVIGQGHIEGISAGRTTVTATTVDGHIPATANVIVRHAVPEAVVAKKVLSGLNPNGTYLINGTEECTADEQGNIQIENKWKEKTITIVRTDDDEELNSDPQSLKVTYRPSDAVSIKKVKVTGFKTSKSYTGEAVVQNAKLTYGSGKKAYTLVEDTDYTVTYKNNYDLGTATVIYEGIKDEDDNYIGRFTGTLKKTFKINGKYTLTLKDGEEGNCEVTLEEEAYAFTDSAIKPKVTVTATLVNNNGELVERVLRQGKDFTVTYKNNIKVAAADAKNKQDKDVAPQVIIKGKGNYVFADTADMRKGVVRRFAITQRDLDDLVITVSDVPYNKAANKYKKTTISFYNQNYKKLKLTANKDYTVSYITPDGASVPAAGDEIILMISAANDGEGNYTGNYTGEESLTYRVVNTKQAKAISKTKVSVASCNYTGEPICPGQEDQPALKVTIGKGKKLRTLTQDVDYEILGYYNNTAVSKNAVVLIRGLGEFYGTRAVKFTIKNPKKK